MKEIQQRERQNNRLDMNREAGWGSVEVAPLIRELEGAAMNRIPQHLIHVAKIKRGRLKCIVA